MPLWWAVIHRLFFYEIFLCFIKPYKLSLDYKIERILENKTYTNFLDLFLGNSFLDSLDDRLMRKFLLKDFAKDVYNQAREDYKNRYRPEKLRRVQKQQKSDYLLNASKLARYYYYRLYTRSN